MKIAFVTLMAGASWGGSEALWAAAAQAAAAAGHEVMASMHALVAGHPNAQQLQRAGVRIHVHTRHADANQTAPSLGQRVLRRVLRSIREVNPDAPYQEMMGFGPDYLCISCGHVVDLLRNPALQELLVRFEQPYCIINQYNDERGTLPIPDAQRLKNLYKRARQVFFVSHRNLCTTRRQLVSQLTNASVVKNPVNLSDTSLVAFPADDTAHFACVARLECNYKGQELLIQILSEARWRERKWKLNLYGTGPDEAYLQELIAFHNLSDRVVLKGHAGDMRRVWAENQIQLMPSYGEGTPLSLVEAMLCGRPAVVTDVGGNGEITQAGETGFVAEAASVHSFGKALEEAWESRSRWREMGKRAHEKALHFIDPDPGKTLLDEMMKPGGRVKAKKALSEATGQ
jgi:glycosyltransferase involved in cell wall biosynthesis